MTYTVKKGDTLTSIAKMHGTTVEAIMASNPSIKDKNLIFVGQIIRIPTNNNMVYNLLVSCLDAIQDLEEYKALESILEE